MQTRTGINSREVTTMERTLLRSGSRPGHGLPRLLDWIETRRSTALQRRRLLDLDQHLLDDIGVTRAEAVDEARILRWDAPAHWRR
jgi:uncharacterized protein YjiS (DUF1127 family)